MAIPADVEHVVFGGSLIGGEQWQTGFWLRGSTAVLPHDQATANAEADLMLGTALSSDPSGALRISLATIASVQVSLTYCRVYVYLTSGPNADLIGEAVPTSPVHGTGDLTMPNQVAAVISLRSQYPGRSRRGRMYLPATAAQLISTGELSHATCDQLAAAWGHFFQDIAAASGVGDPCVVSRTHTYSSAISTVVVDSRLDIQRRRANSQLIDYRATALAL